MRCPAGQRIAGIKRSGAIAEAIKRKSNASEMSGDALAKGDSASYIASGWLSEAVGAASRRDSAAKQKPHIRSGCRAEFIHDQIA
jgi:hypothetical protein